MTTCPACNRPIEPIAQIRTYHSGCDPQMRVEMLERVLRECIVRAGIPDPLEACRAVIKTAADALEFRPAQMKGRE